MDAETESEAGPGPSKRHCKAGGHFKASWKLPPGITSSTKGNKYAYCKYCFKHFLVSHGGFNDITRHINGASHQQRSKDVQGTSNLSSLLSVGHAAAQLTHARKVMSAEIIMCKFVAMHNISFQTMDHLSPLMKPDSAIASDFACKHTKTKSIVCDLRTPAIIPLICSVMNLMIEGTR